MPEQNDFLTTNFLDFNAPREHIPFEPHKPKTAEIVPEISKLFGVQKDLVKAVNALLDEHPDHHDLAVAKANVENAYRQLNSYLRTYSSGPGGGTF